MARRPSNAHQALNSRKVAKPQGPTVHGVLVAAPGRMLFLSGQLPREAPRGQMVDGPIRKHCEVAFANLRNLILEAGFVMDELVSTTMYLTELKHMSIVDELWRKQFVGQTLPARTVVQVQQLPDGALVCVDGVVVKQADAPAAMPPQQPQYEDEMY